MIGGACDGAGGGAGAALWFTNHRGMPGIALYFLAFRCTETAVFKARLCMGLWLYIIE